MGDKKFGVFLRILRSQKTKIDEDGVTRHWAQKDLAKASNVSVRQISRIEQGQTENLREYLNPLAQALGLNDTETSEFFAKAGYLYTPKHAEPGQDVLKTWLAQLHHPASVRTPLWDFVAFNEYHRVLRGYSKESLESLDNGILGPNLLRVLFAPEFNRQADRHSHVPGWAEKTIWAFRAVSLRYADTSRYATIRREMEGYPDFAKAWQRSVDLPALQGPEVYRRQITKVVVPGLGKMEFMSLRIPHIFTGPELIISVYVPLATSEERYLELRKTIKRNRVHFFRDEPVE